MGDETGQDIQALQARAALVGLAIWPLMRTPSDEFGEACASVAAALAEEGGDERLQMALAAMAAAYETAAAAAKEAEPIPADELIGGPRSLAVERTRLYRGVDSRGPKPPYEAEWDEFAPTEAVTVGGVSAAYREAGRGQSTQDRVDYLGVELGFYQQLLGDEVVALQAGDREEAHMASERRSRFFAAHLGKWAPIYVRYGLDQTNDAFYQGHLAFVQALLEIEQRIQMRER